MGKFKVIFHLDDEERTVHAFSNMNNLIADLGEDELNIELLTNGSGIKSLLKDQGYGKEIDFLRRRGVIFGVCSNSMRGLNITEDKMVEGIKIVHSGVGELVKKQDLGWNYIKV